MEPISVAEVLLAVTPGDKQRDLPMLLVRRLQHCPWEERASIARSLVEVLKLLPNVRELISSSQLRSYMDADIYINTELRKKQS